MKIENNSLYILAEAFKETAILFKDSKKESNVMEEVFKKLGNIPFSNFAGTNNREEIEKIISKSSGVQETVLSYFINIRYYFALLGGDWSELVKMLNVLAVSVGNDTSFKDGFKGYNKEKIKESDFTVILSLASIFVKRGF